MSEVTNTYVTEPVKSEGLPEADLATLLGVNDADEEWYDVPKWGFKIKIKSLSKADQIRARKMATRQGKLDSDAFEGYLLMAGIVSPRIGPDSLDRLQSKSVGVVSGILRRILELSNMMDDEEKAAEDDFQD